jgi:hypothetical protein
LLRGVAVSRIWLFGQPEKTKMKSNPRVHDPNALILNFKNCKFKKVTYRSDNTTQRENTEGCVSTPSSWVESPAPEEEESFTVWMRRQQNERPHFLDFVRTRKGLVVVVAVASGVL